MAERSQFWQTGTTGDGATTITEAQTTEWFRDLTTPRADSNGPATAQAILRGVLNELAVTGAASPVSVATGAASIAGRYYKNDTAVSVAVPTPAGATRIDRIVLRVQHGTTRTVRITRIAGTEGSGSAPALIQTVGTTWDIPLAQVSITTGGVITITDQRVYAQFATNHVKRDGDTMTGPLTAPALTVTGAAAVGALSIGGATPWTTANDGQGSGLDADLVAGVAIEPLTRQGGSASNWILEGTTTHSPGGFRIQVGARAVSGTTPITFPVAFTQPPLVMLQILNSDGVTRNYNTQLSAVLATGFSVAVVKPDGIGSSATVFWLAIGPT